jgi:hypothetical protein
MSGVRKTKTVITLYAVKDAASSTSPVSINGRESWRRVSIERSPSGNWGKSSTMLKTVRAIERSNWSHQGTCQRDGRTGYPVSERATASSGTPSHP